MANNGKEIESGKYFELLSNKYKNKSTPVLERIQEQMSPLVQLMDVPEYLIKAGRTGQKITEKLTRLQLKIAKGNKSWQGLVVAFPGSQNELSTRVVGTPYLREILFPILDLHHRIQEFEDMNLPCVYFIGERFSDVFIRKFYLLDQVIPLVIILTNDLFNCYLNKSQPPVVKGDSSHESWSSMKLCQKMLSGLSIPTLKGPFETKFLSHEVPCSEGSENPERLDILGYDNKDGTLIAFELKGPKADRVQLENLFLQGMEHQNWLERNKMAIKLLYDRKCPKNRPINSRKRVRLILGFYQSEVYGVNVPDLFFELRRQARVSDPYLDIDFVRLAVVGDEVKLSLFENDRY